MVEVRLNFYRIQKSRLNELSSRTQPAARKLRYSVSVLTAPGFHPWLRQARHQERTSCRQSEDSDHAAICKWPAVLQSRSKTASPGLSIHVLCEAGRYSRRSQRDRLSGSVSLIPPASFYLFQLPWMPRAGLLALIHRQKYSQV